MEWLWNLWLIMVIVGVFLLVLAIILTLVFNVPSLLDELSGRKAKRQIKRLKEANIGTGALEGMGTEDVYMAASSGSLLSEEIAMVTPKQESEPQEPKKFSPLNLGNKKEETLIVNGDPEEDIPTTDMENGVYSSEDEATNFMDETEAETSYIDDSEATGILQDIEEFCKSRSIIEIVEEQTSL